MTFFNLPFRIRRSSKNGPQNWLKMPRNGKAVDRDGESRAFDQLFRCRLGSADGVRWIRNLHHDAQVCAAEGTEAAIELVVGQAGDIGRERRRDPSLQVLVLELHLMTGAEINGPCTS